MYTYSVLSVVNSINEYNIMFMKSYVVSQQFLGVAGELRKTGTVLLVFYRSRWIVSYCINALYWSHL